MDHNNLESDKNLYIAFSGVRECFTVGKSVIRMLNHPSYVGFRVNSEWNSIIVYGCSSKEHLSFKVPNKIFEDKYHTFRVYSKAFVYELIKRNHLSLDTNYMIPGTYRGDRNVVLFNLKDAFKHNKGVIEEITPSPNTI